MILVNLGRAIPEQIARMLQPEEVKRVLEVLKVVASTDLKKVQEAQRYEDDI